MKSKHAQIQMMETIAVLLIFFVIVVIGFMFFLKISTSSNTQKIVKDQELESIRVSQTISFLPELQCASKNIVQDNCFDKYKLDAFENLSDKENIYYPFFYFSEITIDEIYPNEFKWVLYNRTRYSTYFITSIPILLYDPALKVNSFGLLNVKYYTVS